MLGSKILELYNFIFNTAIANKNFELYTDMFDEFSFQEFKDEIEKFLCISDITPSYLQHEITGPRFIEAYKKRIRKVKH